MARKYGPGVAKEIEKAMHEYKHDHKFKNRKQAIAVGISKAKEKGATVPRKKGD